MIAELKTRDTLVLSGGRLRIADGNPWSDDLEEIQRVLEEMAGEGIAELLIYAEKSAVPRDLIRAIKAKGLLASHIQPHSVFETNDFLPVRKHHGALVSRARKHASALIYIGEVSDDLVFFLAGLVLFAQRDLTPAQACIEAVRQEGSEAVMEALGRYAAFLQDGSHSGNGAKKSLPSHGDADAFLARTQAQAPGEDIIPSTAGRDFEAATRDSESAAEIPAESPAYTESPAAVETPAPVLVESPAPAAMVPAPAAPVSAAPAAVSPAPATPPPAPAPAPKKAASSIRKPADDFKASRATIKVKMLSIISAIVVAALTAMIFLATFFFRADSERSIQGTNLSTTEIIGLQLKSEIETISYKSHLMGTTLEQPQAADQKKLFVDLFLQNNSQFMFIGVARRAGDSIAFGQVVTNDKFLKDNNISQEDLNRLNQQNGKAFLTSFAGATVVHNASSGFKIPLVAVSVPLARGESIVVSYLDPASFIKAFQQTAAAIPGTTAFLVNQNGDVIAHPDSKLVLSGTNLADSPIIKALLESKVDNGQTRYQDKNGMNLGAYKKLGIGGLGIVSTAEENVVFQPVFNIQRRNIYIMVIVVALSFIVVYLFSKTITVPIVKLVGATRQVEQGDYGIDIQPASGDEIGVLTHSFVNMAVGLEEREKLKDAMGKFTNPEIAEMVLRGEMKLGGERKDAAIFFSDLRGFTAMSENMEPEEVVEFLNEYFTDMVNCVDVTGGVVDKFIGDAVMAHWGALFSRGNDTENSVNAAIMMRKALIAFNQRPVTKSGKKKPIAMFGCGINTGPVISGQIGSETRLDYTVIGDTVNLASRVESLNKPFGTDILITTDAYERVRDIFQVEEMPAIKVKGKSEPQIIYAVLGRLDDPDRPKSLKELRALVGIKFDEEKASKMADAASGEGEVKYEVIGDKSKEKH